jgi:hypothetical protein
MMIVQRLNYILIYINLLQISDTTSNIWQREGEIKINMNLAYWMIVRQLEYPLRVEHGRLQPDEPNEIHAATTATLDEVATADDERLLFSRIWIYNSCVMSQLVQRLH